MTKNIFRYKAPERFLGFKAFLSKNRKVEKGVFVNPNACLIVKEIILNDLHKKCEADPVREFHFLF